MENENIIQPPTPAPVIEQTPPVFSSSLKISKRLMILIILFVVIAAFGFGAYLLGAKTKTPQSVQPTPLAVTQPTPTPDPTASWKTYMGKIDGYQIKLPETWDLSEHRPFNEVFINSKEPDPKISGVGKYQLIIQTRELFPEQTYDDAVVENNQVGAQEFNPGGPKPPTSVVKKSTNFLKEYYYVVLANSLRSAAIPLANKHSLVLIHILNWPENQDYSLFDQILSTFKFTD